MRYYDCQHRLTHVFTYIDVFGQQFSIIEADLCFVEFNLYFYQVINSWPHNVPQHS